MPPAPRTKSPKPKKPSPPKKHGWGGWRPGAGRKPGPNPRTLHRASKPYRPGTPVRLTLVALPELPSLRTKRVLRAVEQAIVDAGPEGFRLVAYAVESHRVDLVVEADDLDTLTVGIRSVTASVALQVNKALGRRGHVWGDRYRRKDLETPRHLREALAELRAQPR